MPPDLQDIRETLRRHETLLQDNNRLMRKLNRRQNATLVVTMIWYGLLIGLPFAVYYYFVGPYIESWGLSGSDYGASLRELPGYQQFEAFFGQAIQDREQPPAPGS